MYVRLYVFCYRISPGIDHCSDATANYVNRYLLTVQNSKTTYFPIVPIFFWIVTEIDITSETILICHEFIRLF